MNTPLLVRAVTAVAVFVGQATTAAVLTYVAGRVLGVGA